MRYSWNLSCTIAQSAFAGGCEVTIFCVELVPAFSQSVLYSSWIENATCEHAIVVVVNLYMSLSVAV